MRFSRFRGPIVAVYKHRPSLTLQQIADKVGGVSREYVRQVLKAVGRGRTGSPQRFAEVCFCGKLARVRGMCAKHRNNLTQLGDPFGSKRGPQQPATAKGKQERERRKSQRANRRQARRKGFAYACAVAEGNRLPLKPGPLANRTPEFIDGERLAAIYLELMPY